MGGDVSAVDGDVIATVVTYGVVVSIAFFIPPGGLCGIAVEVVTEVEHSFFSEHVELGQMSISLNAELRPKTVKVVNCNV